ncbi:ABC-type nitrate/sulfonate/bicarbonate transport system substrate-binding protein [Sinorhizobium meliloti]
MATSHASTRKSSPAVLAVDVAAARWADANPEETIAIFVKETGNSDMAVRATYPNGKFYQDPEITDAAVRALQGEEAFMADAGLLKGKVDYRTWIDRSFYEAAIKRLAASN